MIAILLGLWATLLLARGTPIGRWLQAACVTAPARWLSQVSPGQWLMLATLFVCVGAVLWFLESEGRVLLSMAAPEIVGFLSAAEVTAYADILATALVAFSTLRPRALATGLRHHVARARTSRRQARPAERASAANDDEPGGDWRLAA